MENILIDSIAEKAEVPVVIPDECGDTMWDAVLGQEAKACGIRNIHTTTSGLLNGIDRIDEQASSLRIDPAGNKQ